MSGTNAVTAEGEPLQVVALKHKKGEAAKPHLHADRRRQIIKTQSCFIVKKGKARVDVYNPEKKLVKSLILKAGDFYVTLAGGHGVAYLADTEMIEIKNGPFREDKVFIQEPGR